MATSEALGAQRHAMILAAGLFAGGSLLTLVATAAPHSPDVDIAGAWVVTFCSAVVAAVYWLGRDSLPRWTLYLGIVLGTVMISSGIYINGERDGGAAALNEVYYVWPVVFAAYYFPVRALVAELVLVGGCYAVALQIVDPGPIALTRWLIVVTMLIGVGGLISRLQARVDELVTRLSETARRDALTGLLNRRGFEERLDAELARATRAERPVALILGDVDHFKTVNDELGHPAGDAVLLRIAGVLEGIGRRSDTVARIGGEEFVFIVPDADSEMAFELAERARVALERTFADEPVPLTASFGTVAFPADGTTATSLLETADRALYAAKRGGRNRSTRAAALV
ncbi:MAG: GGDEF domain-containing protein [Actinomycetota bacterium]|nr:GGDEF domain-containing protein [Actinomycetota bacterium]